MAKCYRWLKLRCWYCATAAWGGRSICGCCEKKKKKKMPAHPAEVVALPLKQCLRLCVLCNSAGSWARENLIKGIFGSDWWAQLLPLPDMGSAGNHNSLGMVTTWNVTCLCQMGSTCKAADAKCFLELPLLLYVLSFWYSCQTDYLSQNLLGSFEFPCESPI